MYTRQRWRLCLLSLLLTILHWLLQSNYWDWLFCPLCVFNTLWKVLCKCQLLWCLQKLGTELRMSIGSYTCCVIMLVFETNANLTHVFLSNNPCTVKSTSQVLCYFVPWQDYFDCLPTTMKLMICRMAFAVPCKLSPTSCIVSTPMWNDTTTIKHTFIIGSSLSSKSTLLASYSLHCQRLGPP